MLHVDQVAMVFVNVHGIDIVFIGVTLSVCEAHTDTNIENAERKYSSRMELRNDTK